MKNIPIIGKFIAIMAIFGIFALAVALYGSMQVKSIDAANTALLKNELRASLMMARANRALQATRGAIGDLLIQSTAEGNAASKAEIEKSAARFAEFMDAAAAAIPANPVPAGLKADGLRLINETCGPAIALGVAAVDQAANVAAQQVFLKECQPQFSALAAKFTEETNAVVADADAKSLALEVMAAETARIMLVAVVVGLVVVTGLGFFAIRAWWCGRSARWSRR